MKALINFVIVILVAIEPIAFVLFFVTENSVAQLILAAFLIGSYLLAKKLYKKYLAATE